MAVYTSFGLAYSSGTLADGDKVVSQGFTYTYTAANKEWITSKRPVEVNEHDDQGINALNVADGANIVVTSVNGTTFDLDGGNIDFNLNTVGGKFRVYDDVPNLILEINKTGIDAKVPITAEAGIESHIIDEYLVVGSGTTASGNRGVNFVEFTPGVTTTEVDPAGVTINAAGNTLVFTTAQNFDGAGGGIGFTDGDYIKISGTDLNDEVYRTVSFVNPATITIDPTYIAFNQNEVHTNVTVAKVYFETFDFQNVGDWFEFSNHVNLGSASYGYMINDTNALSMPVPSVILIGDRAGDTYSAGVASDIYIGYQAGFNTGGNADKANYNVGIGTEALYGGAATFTGDNNLGIGYRAGYTIAAGSNNVLLGYQAGYNIEANNYNTAIGTDALYGDASFSGSDNIGIGYQTGYKLKAATGNIFLGYTAGYTNEAGNNNIFLGYTAGFYATGNRNSGIGYGALKGAVAGFTGDNNIGIGYQTGDALTSGTQNILIGYQAGYASDDSTGNVSIGYSAGLNSSGNYNISIGYSSGYSLAAANNNVLIGFEAGYNTQANTNIGIGYRALKGAGTPNFTGSENVGIGYQAGLALTSGARNIMIGDSAGQAITTGASNILFGYQAGLALTTTNYGIFIGTQAGLNVTTADNIGIGYLALRGTAGSTGIDNIGIGYQPGLAITTGSSNILIGYEAGLALTTGGSNVIIGHQAGVTASTHSGNVFIGYQAGNLAAASNQLYIENSNSTTPLIFGDFTNDYINIYALGTVTADHINLKLTNTANNAAMTGTSTSIEFNQYYNDAAPAIADAGKISVVTETNWTAAAATQDAYMAFSTALDGTVAERVRIDSAGNLSLITSNTELRFYEGVNYVGFEAPALTGNQIWVLPSADGVAGYALTTDGGGNLSWAEATGGLDEVFMLMGV